LNNRSYSQKQVFDYYQEVKDSMNESKLIELITTRKLSVTSVNKEKVTPLMYAIDLGFSIDTIDKLVKAGSDVNAQDDDGMTPLHYCFYNDYYEIFEYLVHTAKADLNIAEEEDGPTILEECEE